MVGEEEREPLASVVVGPAIDNSASVNHPGAKVTSVAYSKEGTYLATADDDGKVLIQDAATSENRPPVTHEGYPVNAIAFSPDGAYLATASDDKTARVQRWRSEGLVDEACARLTRNLTKEEWRQHLGDEPYHKTCENLPEPEE